MDRVFGRTGFKKAPALLFVMALVFAFLWQCPPASALAFRVASYNVQNLFDADTDGTEYPDYVPGGSTGWNAAMAGIKAENTARVIAALSAEIVCLQEVESEQALKLLLAQLKKRGKSYPFHAIARQPDTAVRCALISMFPIRKTDTILPGEGLRAILSATVIIQNRPLVIYVNHWKSKSGPESRRITSAVALKRRIDRLAQGTDFILAGDFNANYNEFKTIRDSEKLNDTGGVTGINHILGTIADGRLVTEKRLQKTGRGLYNLWLELPPSRRWSYNFFGRKNSLDSIILPPALYDGNGIDYVNDSFNKFDADFLFKDRAVFRWQQKNHGRGKHLGRGYSDHLPIFAVFKTTP